MSVSFVAKALMPAIALVVTGTLYKSLTLARTVCARAVSVHGSLYTNFIFPTLLLSLTTRKRSN